MRGRPQISAVNRFFGQFLISDGCWEWQGSRYGFGYGRLYLGDGTRVKAHRFSYELFNGSVPRNLCVLHYCDNPICVRPDHLFLGTLSDNTQDMVSKGRHPRSRK